MNTTLTVKELRLLRILGKRRDNAQLLVERNDSNSDYWRGVMDSTTLVIRMIHECPQTGKGVDTYRPDSIVARFNRGSDLLKR